MTPSIEAGMQVPEADMQGPWAALFALYTVHRAAVSELLYQHCTDTERGSTVSMLFRILTSA